MLNKYNAVAFVHKGFEEVASKEIFELIGAKSIVNPGAVLFNPQNESDLYALAYQAQSISKVMHLNSVFDVSKDFESTLTSFKKNLDEKNLSIWSNKKFKVESFRQGDHEFASPEIESGFGPAISQVIGSIDIKNPEIIFDINIIDDLGYIGISVCNFELDKRDYRIFTHPSELKSTFSYFLLRHAGYEKNKIVVDPFMKSGSIPIEAAHYALNMPIHFHKKNDFPENIEPILLKIDKKIKHKSVPVFGFDSSMSSVKSAEKNSKLAGINKAISFSRIDIERLDLKMGKKSVNFIVSHLPNLSHRMGEKLISKIYDKFFYQAEFILKKNGMVCISVKDLSIIIGAAEKYGFKLLDQKDIYFGKSKYVVARFSNEN